MPNESTSDAVAVRPAAAADEAAPTRASGKVCANCGAPMLGPFCHACGQPEKGMIRHLASVMADVADTLFNIDSRVFRSIGPLYFRPGFLTCEYFAGRRTRYVTPFRLFFFLCIVSFFAIQSSITVGDLESGAHSKLETRHGIGNAQTEADLRERTRQALDELAAAKNKSGLPQAAIAPIDAAAVAVRAQSAKRLAYLKTRDEALAKGLKAPVDASEDDNLHFDFPWGSDTTPIRIAWLPDFANTKLTSMVGHARDNVLAARRDPRRAIAGMFAVLPQTLFVMMPLFAVLLKITYLFKRRLYMEHLMVALHSHAFIFLSLLLLTLVSFLIGWAGIDSAAAPILRLLSAAIWIWLPVYLFLMQKRVYGQGWTMTSLKFAFVGLCYVVMLSLGMAAAVIVSLATA